MQNHNDTNNNKDAGRFFIKILLPLILFVRLRKGYSRFACARELENNINCNILTPNSYGHQRCVFLVLLMLNRRPRAHSSKSWLSLLHLISNFSGLQTPSGFPRAPSAGCGFPYHTSSITPSPTGTATGTALTSVLTELYNSSTPTRSLTRSLKSHVWSSSSGNNCHAVHRSLSSGASVYECTTGIFLPRPISSANFRPRDFLS